MNQEQRKQLIIVGILGVVLVAVLVYQFTRTPPPPSGVTSASSAPAVPAEGAANQPAASAAPGQQPAKTELKHTDINIDELLANIKEVDFDYERDRMPRDPLTPLVGKMAKLKVKEGEEGKVVAPATTIEMMNKAVTGILWDSRRPLAVVDDEVVYPGYEYPNGAVVESITRDRVVFKVGDSLIEVPLKEL
jgi:hypothetical protein